MKTQIVDRLSALRKVMKEQHISAYIIPTTDPHMSEYPGACWKYRVWISGFTGSFGTVVVTLDKAGLWTDSRYFLQAEDQLAGTGIDVYKLKIEGTPSITEFLLSELAPGETVGLNGETFSAQEADDLAVELGRKQISLNTEAALLDQIWTDRPAIPEDPVFDLPIQYSGRSTADKIADINARLQKAGADCTILSALDEVAWTCNFRGTDVAYNPVAVAYMFVSNKENVLFINPKKVPADVAERLKSEGVILADYTRVYYYLSKLPTTTRIYVDTPHTNKAICNALPKGVEIISGISIANSLKSIKNETERKGYRNAVLKDGVALTKFFYWLEQEMAAGHKVTELSASHKLTALRAEQPLYVMDSFASISSYGPHGAVVHYTVAATPEQDAELKPDSLYLLDSGGQYLDGTTDVTRTIALCKNPTDQMKKDFTLTLKGTITLGKCKFPTGMRGSQLDILARKALWDAGINYLHGTCHGIGHCLNVHEGPQSIRMEENPVLIEAGMVMSDEPAMYRTGQYGVRTENMIEVVEDCKTEYGTFLRMETLTLCYIDTSLVVVSMLSPREHAWLNKYHQNVYEKLSPFLTEEEKAWLKVKTAEI